MVLRSNFDASIVRSDFNDIFPETLESDRKRSPEVRDPVVYEREGLRSTL
jgi:hypothetical protein